GIDEKRLHDPVERKPEPPGPGKEPAPEGLARRLCRANPPQDQRQRHQRKRPEPEWRKAKRRHGPGDKVTQPLVPETNALRLHDGCPCSLAGRGAHHSACGRRSRRRLIRRTSASTTSIVAPVSSTTISPLTGT